jgi:hypothetical protein
VPVTDASCDGRSPGGQVREQFVVAESGALGSDGCAKGSGFMTTSVGSTPRWARRRSSIVSECLTDTCPRGAQAPQVRIVRRHLNRRGGAE